MEFKRIFKDGIHLLAAQTGTVIIGLVSLMILSRVLSTEQMGKYSLFLMIVNLVLIVGLNWSDTSVVRHGREEFVKHKKINKSFWARMYIFVPTIALFTLLFIIFFRQITAYIGIEPKLIILLIIMFIFNGFLNFLSYLYQSIDQMKKSAYALFSQKAFYLVCLALAFLGIFKTNLTIVLIFINLSFLLSLIIYLSTFNFRKILPYKFSRSYLKKIWAYSWPQLIGFPGLYLLNYIDLFFIRKYWTLQDVGTYSVAYTGFLSICGFVMLIYTLLFPLTIEYRAKKKFHLIKSYLYKIPLFTLGWVFFALAGILLSKFVIPLLFSTKYIAAIPSFNILLVASIFYFASVCLLPLVNAFDLIIYLQIFNLIKAVVNIAADFVLIPKLGIIGGAIGTTLSYIVGLALTIGLIMAKKKKILGKSPT